MKNSFKILIFIFVFTMSCNSKKEEQQQIKNISKIQKDTDTIKLKEQVIIKDKVENSKIKVIVLQCSNGYGHNDFNRTIESEISKNEGFDIVPFPNKNLLGVTFQGVYDKKYCEQIIEKLDVDYIIMTRFLGNINEEIEIIGDDFTWGYEIKILNVKSMNQKISIRKDNLDEYQNIITDIKNKGGDLINDIKNLI